MARITKSDSAPKDAKAFYLGVSELKFPNKNSVVETDNPTVISDAVAHPWLEVEFDVVDASPAKREGYDANDPHDNPTADHLSVWASDAAVEAAAANETAIRDSAGLDILVSASGNDADNPTVAEDLAETHDVVDADAPALPEKE